MSPSTTSDSPVSPVTKSNNAESNLQPFFILQKSLPQLSEKRPAGSVKTRRRIDLSQASPKEKSDAFQAVEGDNYVHKHVPVEAFEDAWSNIENTIKGRFRQINDDLFEEICCWIDRSFKTIKSSGTLKISEVTRPYSTVLDSSDKQIFTALMLTKNVEFVDDLLTFEELRVHLKSHSFHVASLSSADFCMKDGVGRCLRSLLWQLVAVSVEVADIAILAAWYIKAENYDKPVVVIIDDMERCNGSVLAEFIALLSQWVVKIPIILLVGVATTVDAPAKLLPSNTLQHLQPCKFTMGSPLEKLDAIIEDVLVKQNIGFNIGYSVAAFLKNYFLKHDGTITSFIRAIKIACVKHFLLEPLSFLGNGMLEEDEQDFWKEKCETLPDELLKHAFALPSCQREEDVEMTRDDLALGLSKLKRTREKWGSVVMCLYEVGKYQRMHLLDIFCEALNPDSACVRPSDCFLGGSDHGTTDPSTMNRIFERKSSHPTTGRFIMQALQKVRDLPLLSLSKVLKSWGKQTQKMAEVNLKVKKLQSMVGDGSKLLKPQRPNNHGTSQPRSRLNVEIASSTANEMAATLLESMIRNYLKPMECMPFHEIVCFKHVNILLSALIGDPRRTVQVDLLKSHTYLHCSCCHKPGNALLPTTHDTSIMYHLAQEQGDLINLHDWYQSFKGIILSSGIKGKKKVVQSPVSRKRKATNATLDISEASIQARFCRAVTELQITGLLRMPSKRRPDFVQRVAFGL